MCRNVVSKEENDAKDPIIKQLLSILKIAPTKEHALRQIRTLFERDEALSNTLV
jgi:hypothetical protein